MSANSTVAITIWVKGEARNFGGKFCGINA